MQIRVLRRLALPGLAMLAVASASLIASASTEPPAAYGAEATRFEGEDALLTAGATFDRSDLNRDGVLGEDEYAILAVVTAELARLNGFVAVGDRSQLKTIAFAAPSRADLSASEKAAIRSRAHRAFARIAGDDEKLTREEFADARLEEFIASDFDRNGVLTGAELRTFAQIAAGFGQINS